MLFLSTHIV